jgi:hypothetical protein
MALVAGALVGSAGLALFFTCDNNLIPPGQNSTANGLCTYPRGCYLVNASGPNIGQCDDNGCTAVPKAPCREVFTPLDPTTYDSSAGNPAGTWSLTTSLPTAADWQAVCGWNDSVPAGKVSLCADPSLVCIARGPACSGYCVHLSAAAPPDGGAAALCSTGVPVPPQRRPGSPDGGTQTYCQLVDDVCCPGPMPDAGASDGGGGVSDGGVSDGGAVDQAGRD